MQEFLPVDRLTQKVPGLVIEQVVHLGVDVAAHETLVQTQQDAARQVHDPLQTIAQGLFFGLLPFQLCLQLADIFDTLAVVLRGRIRRCDDAQDCIRRPLHVLDQPDPQLDLQARTVFVEQHQTARARRLAREHPLQRPAHARH